MNWISEWNECETEAKLTVTLTSYLHLQVNGVTCTRNMQQRQLLPFHRPQQPHKRVASMTYPSQWTSSFWAITACLNDLSQKRNCQYTLNRLTPLSTELRVTITADRALFTESSRKSLEGIYKDLRIWPAVLLTSLWAESRSKIFPKKLRQC